MHRWLLLLALGACGDPVRDAIATDLGPERADVARGPLHRAGEPCLTCHGGSGPREFSVAGTVQRSEGATAAAVGAQVELVDSTGATFTTATNCAGNFFVEPADFTPTYPLWVAVSFGTTRIEMDSPIQRDGSCASCHAATSSPASAGPVYLVAEGEPAPKASSACP